MTTWLVTHPACLEHDTGPGHPENPDRLRAVLRELESPEFEFLVREEAPQATREQLERAHDPPYVRSVLESIPDEGLRHLDSDTVVSPGSGEAALRAAGAVVHGVDAVMGGMATTVFCAVRPPGHHAESDRAMGFCLFNNVAVGAAHALAGHGLERVAIMDFDVHHGNGTEDIAQSRPRMYYLSTHQHPLFPGTGTPDDKPPAHIVNVQLAHGDGSEAFRAAFEEQILPRLDLFRPELLFISAGFDAHRSDPLATMQLEADDFVWATRQLMEKAGRYANGRVVSVLEGGYSLTALARCTRAHVQTLMGL